ncbi:MAG TPA: hypothetical protein VNI57_02805 [Candidatus Saccharimonadales bacterium]|nr:hypothetical protein [Candidatus Saccharimonadales bacterium]
MPSGVLQGGDVRAGDGTRGKDSGDAGGHLYTVAELESIAAESSRLERRAEEAERSVNDLLVAHHMRGRIGEVFGGRVSGKIRSGIFVALEGEGISPGAVEGFAPVARSESFRLTEPVRVRLEEADLLRGRLRLSVAEA